MGIFKNKIETTEADAPVDTVVARYISLKAERERLFNNAITNRTAIADMRIQLQETGCDMEDLAMVDALDEKWIDAVIESVDGLQRIPTT